MRDILSVVVGRRRAKADGGPDLRRIMGLSLSRKKSRILTVSGRVT